MEAKKINLEDLFDELRELSENYEVDSLDNDVFVLSNTEINSFADDINKIVKNFIKKELSQLEEEDSSLIDEDDEDEDGDSDNFLFIDMYEDDLS